MALAFNVGSDSYEIGSAPFLKAFFSTVFVLVENEDWGSQFPVIMNDLYSGWVDSSQAGAARDELKSVKTQLSRFSPSHVVWDFENRDSRPPWGDDKSDSITSMADYFVTSGGKDLIEVLDEALAKSNALNVPVTIS